LRSERGSQGSSRRGDGGNKIPFHIAYRKAKRTVRRPGNPKMNPSKIKKTGVSNLICTNLKVADFGEGSIAKRQRRMEGREKKPGWWGRGLTIWKVQTSLTNQRALEGTWGGKEEGKAKLFCATSSLASRVGPGNEAFRHHTTTGSGR